MTSNEIRDTYLHYFENHGHSIIPSASLLIHDDPTLLWNNAGVTPLKKYFDGTIIPSNKRMTSSQKCIRTNDIESVGDDTHLTFFEMLGNFSIGDYFKDEAITMAFELLTDKKYFGFPKDKLYMTVYIDDDDAFNKWVEVGVDPSHIIRLADNFWEIGEGPCGPDSEIFYDRGEEFDKDKLGIKLLIDGIDNSRYVEIWNNVFSQFNSKEGVERSKYKELPNKNIDTGMGLERMTCVINGVTSAYDTDLFQKIITKIEELSGKNYKGEKEFRIIADHIRTLTFAISDGAVFSNEGRGYVIRRLLRRAYRFGHNLGIDGNFMYKIVPSVVETMEYYYPELRRNIDIVSDTIRKEEELFSKTLASGEKKLDEMLSNITGKVLSGEDAFKLYDTYGFPYELTLEYLNELGYTTSKEVFDKCMKEQKELARNNREKINSMNVQNEALLKFKENSVFTGYDEYETDAKVISLIKGDKSVKELSGEGYIILNKTPFYSEKGGQVSDIGYIYNDKMKAEVIDVFSSPNKQNVHIVNVDGKIKVNDKVTAKINAKRRNSIEKNHSACHLLDKALKDALKYEVEQAGSKIDEYTLRFDFTYPNKISDAEVITAEALVNEMINTNSETITEIMDINDAKKTDAVHLFDEKYDDKVRVVTISNSKEFCGGTHVRNTKEINKFAIKSIESKGANVYRIVAVTDDLIESSLFDAIKPYNDDMIKLLTKAKSICDEAKDFDIKLNFDVEINNDKPKCYADIVFNRNEVLMVKEKVKELEKEFTLKKNNKLLKEDTIFSNFDNTNDLDYIITKVNNYDINLLKTLIDNNTNNKDNYLVFVANINGNNVNYICKSKSTFNAGSLVKDASIKSNGNGGGSNTFAQGGGTDISKVDEILNEIRKQL